MYIYKISKKHVEIARAEIEILLGKTTSLDEHLFLVDNYSPEAHHLAYTKEIYNVLATSAVLDEVLATPIEHNYRCDTIHLDTLEIADKLYALHHKAVKLENYDHRYVVIFLNDRYYFCEEVYVNEDTGEGRRAHQRAYNHPTSMHPLLAKAMVNLCGKKTFIDPFCGAGGILIEGALMGYEVLGTDISEEMIDRADENLTELGLVAQLTVQNALVIESNYDAIVTDLPYGKNSILESVDLYDAFLENAKHISDILVVGCKEGAITDLHGWKLVYRFSIYTHKSLTREILVLKK